MSKLYKDRLVNVKRGSDQSIICQCPACAAMGEDQVNKNHLKIFKTGAFSCVKYQGDKDHNKIIYNMLFDADGDDYIIDNFGIQKPNYVKFYPEETLLKLVKNHDYWINRKISIDVLDMLEGGLAPSDEKGKLSGRYCFPIRDLNRKIIGFSGRLATYNTFAPKWKHLFKVGDVAYPFHITKPYIEKEKSVILVESIGDMLALMTHGIFNVLVIFGLHIKSKVISALISSNPNKIIISTNNDSDKQGAGNKAALKIHSKLYNFFDQSRLEVYIPKSKDWGEANELGTQELLELRKKIDEEREKYISQ